MQVFLGKASHTGNLLDSDGQSTFFFAFSDDGFFQFLASLDPSAGNIEIVWVNVFAFAFSEDEEVAVSVLEECFDCDSKCFIFNILHR
jgi:hypothetical protein